MKKAGLWCEINLPLPTSSMGPQGATCGNFPQDSSGLREKHPCPLRTPYFGPGSSELVLFQDQRLLLFPRLLPPCGGAMAAKEVNFEGNQGEISSLA